MYGKLIDELRRFNVVYSTGKLNPNASITITKNTILLESLTASTPFLSIESKIRERLYCVLNSITEVQCCPVCNTTLHIKSSGRLEYPQYCSRSCMYKSPARSSKKKNTMNERYGVEYTAQSDQLHDKMKATCVAHLGVDNPFKSSTIQRAINNKVQKKYDVTNVMHDSVIRNRQKEACNNKDFVAISNKIKKSTFNNNGYNNVLQQHLTRKQLDLLDDAKWLNKKHTIEKLTLIEIAELIGVDSTTISLRFKKHNIDVQRFASSIGEKQILQFLIDDIGIDVEQGNRTMLNGKELDLYIPGHNIAIEYCGLYWHADIHHRINSNYHKVKHDMCNKLGIQLITIFEDEWIHKRVNVQAKLRSVFNVDDRPIVYARRTQVVLVSNQDKVNFFNNYHIQGTGPGSINIGLVSDGELVACMSFIKCKNKHYLNRYATSNRIIGGGGKLLNYFKKNYKWSQLVSFADLRWSNGALYENTGWTLDKVISPDYSYSPDGMIRYHKFNYRRKNLSRLLKHYDPKLSERQNCDNNGILRIWDCGKLRYVMYNDT